MLYYDVIYKECKKKQAVGIIKISGHERHDPSGKEKINLEYIEVSHLTKDYGHGRGIYDVSFKVSKGETLGFLGPNGAGKSTTMRQLMGFSKPQSGTAEILGMNCSEKYSEILKHVGYLPGEVALPDGQTGWQFIKMMQGLRKNGNNDERIKYLIDRFHMDPSPNVKLMSIGEKRKLAVIAAFMGDPDVLLLDEPTSGLDPVMQEEFINFIHDEKERGKTILLSSHIFSEIEELCDRIAIIKEGKILTILNAIDVKHGLRKEFNVILKTRDEYNHFLNEGFEITYKNDKSNKVVIVMEDAMTNKFLETIAKYNVTGFSEASISLEDFFMHFYKNDKTFGGVKSGRNHKS
ncbi:ABC transporter ATP-binding protein [Clostridium estertheticum]|uniref:ABC transporter ATP-binding protein n=1 Tax=Clostridium estertheticum TaxID=238834 RepID=UPI001CCCAEFD|nr:ABC transporter ATP-binding protein [Clostridium estertheticum]MBZ9607393.1 ABC transporter ATP-binding protein [Clostridium estertheticum]MBZ9609411.1 ABC transporter ATP-binding protein [Clostridium estertheticum]